MKHLRTFGPYLAILGALFLMSSSTLASVIRNPQAATPSERSPLGINPSTLSSPYASSQHITGVPATVDPRYVQDYTGGLGMSPSTPFYVQQQTSLALSAGSFLFDLFTGKGNQSFTDQLFQFIRSRLFAPVKSSFTGLAGAYGGLGNLGAARDSAVATMRDPYAHLRCPTGDCDPHSMFRPRSPTEDIFRSIP